MLKIIVNGRNIDLTEGIKTHVEDKFNRLDHHFDFIKEIHVFLSVDKNPRIKDSQHAEATIHVSRAVIRVEVTSENLYTSIDQLVEKVDRSLTKHKTKLLGRTKSAKEGETIRKAGYDEALAQEQVEAEHLEDEGVFLQYLDDEDTVSV